MNYARTLPSSKICQCNVGNRKDKQPTKFSFNNPGRFLGRCGSASVKPPRNGAI